MYQNKNNNYRNNNHQYNNNQNDRRNNYGGNNDNSNRPYNRNQGNNRGEDREGQENGGRYNGGGGGGGGGGDDNIRVYQPQNKMVFDGKRMRKSVQRRTVEYVASVSRYLENRAWYRDRRMNTILQPEPSFVIEFMPPGAQLSNPNLTIPTRFVHTSTNKVKCPVNVVKWTPEGRRLITGSSSGEFTLWNGLTFNFETILQAHDTAVRAMEWSHNDMWMITADHSGIVKYWQSNMNNLKLFQAHREPIRDITFSPNDSKFCTCSDDASIKIWNFNEGQLESSLEGHGWDVRCIDWHPYKALIASGSKDNLVKLWDPKSGKAISTLHGHKNTILSLQWNKNGNWLATTARDQLLKVYDIRVMKELQTFRDHKKDISCVQWHPRIEDMLASGGSDGSIKFWRMGYENSVGDIDFAHESPVWSLDWHPLGHIIVSGSNDHTTRFWTRARPGESMGPQDAKFHSTVVKDEFAHVDWNDGAKATLDSKDTNGDAKSNAFQLPGLGNISHEPVNKNSFTSKLFNPSAVPNQPTLLPHQQHHNNQGGNYPPRPMGGLPPPPPPPPFNRHHGPPPPHGQFNNPNYPPRPPRPPHHQNGHQNHQNGHQNHQNGHQGHQGHQNHQNGHQNRHRY